MGDVVYRHTFKLLGLNRILIWNFRTVEGDSPVDMSYLSLCNVLE